jgi:hypothetical protein
VGLGLPYKTSYSLTALIAHDTTARKTRSGDKYNRLNVFRGVTFDDWLRLFFQVRNFPFIRLCLNNDANPSQYCFILTQSRNFSQANEVLRHLQMSSAYQLPAMQDAIRLALISTRFRGYSGLVLTLYQHAPPRPANFPLSSSSLGNC